MIFRGWPLLPEEVAITLPKNEQWNSTKPCTLENNYMIGRRQLESFALKKCDKWQCA
jgi:hypothetical protein